MIREFLIASIVLWNDVDAECHYIGRYEGHDIGSDNLPEKFMSAWRECQEICQDNRFCRFWTYDTLNGDCWLKHAYNGEPYLRPHLDMISGPAYCKASKFSRFLEDVVESEPTEKEKTEPKLNLRKLLGF